MKLQGKLTIGRTSSEAHQENPIARIELRDVNSGVKFVTVEIPLQDLAEALMGLAEVPCEMEFRGLDSLGKIRQIKHELVPRPSFRASREELDNLLEPYEVDGWKGRHTDLTNQYCRNGDRQKVTFIRFVDAESANQKDSELI